MPALSGMAGRLRCLFEGLLLCADVYRPLPKPRASCVATGPMEASR